MASTKWLIATLVIVAICFESSHGATAAALTKKLLPMVAKFENFTTNAQNTGYINFLLNCSYYQPNISVCGSNFFSFLMGNLTSSQTSDVMARGTKYILSAGGSITTAVSKLSDVIVSQITTALWTPLQKKVKTSKTYAAYQVPALKIAKKKITKKFVCAVATKVKSSFSSSWTTVKSCFGGILPCFSLCNL